MNTAIPASKPPLSSHGRPVPDMQAVAHKAADNGPQAGLLAAAIELRALSAQCPQGRQALRDFGFEPVFDRIKGV